METVTFREHPAFRNFKDWDIRQEPPVLPLPDVHTPLEEKITIYVCDDFPTEEEEDANDISMIKISYPDDPTPQDIIQAIYDHYNRKMTPAELEIAKELYGVDREDAPISHFLPSYLFHSLVYSDKLKGWTLCVY